MYYFTTIYLIALYFIAKRLDKKTTLTLSIIPLVLIIVLRFGVGADYFSYEYLYNELDVSSFGTMLNSFNFLEFGFRILMYFGRVSGLPYHVFISVLAIFTASVVLLWIQDNTDDVSLPILLFYSMFFIVWNLSAIRQGMVASLGLFFLFNKRFDLKNLQKIVIIAILSSLHASALVFVPLVFITEIKFSKKTLFILLLFSLILTFIPLQKIFMPLSSLPFIGKFVLYLDGTGKGFLDFSSFVRIIFFLVILYHYDLLVSRDKWTSTITNLSLVSFLLYFMLKFSELVASRLSIFGYFSVIMIFPIIISFYERRRFLYILGISGLLSFSLLSTYKELNASASQAGYKKASYMLNFETIINSNRDNFMDQYNLIYEINELCSSNRTAFLQNNRYVNPQVEASPSDNQTYLSVWFENQQLYGVINNLGEIVETPKYNYRPIIYGNILVEQNQDVAFKRDMYRYIGTDKYIEETEIIDSVTPYIQKDLDLKSKWIVFDYYEYQHLGLTVIPDLIDENVINSLSIGKYGSPFFYEIIEISVYSQTLYLYLDENYSQMGKSVYTEFEPFGINKVAKGVNSCGTEYINEYGTIIWYE